MDMLWRRPVYAAAKFLVSCAIGVIASTAFAAPSPLVVDKLVRRLTGLPATTEQVAAVTSGKKTLVDLADELRQEPRLEERLTQFWLQRLKIVTPVNILQIRDPSRNRNLSQELQVGRDTDASRALDFGGCEAGFNNGKHTGVYRLIVGANSPVQQTAQNCACATAVEAAPYWNPKTTVLVCPDAVTSDRCGASLSACFPDGGVEASRDMSNEYALDIRHALTIEPGLIAARTVLDDKSWDTTLRGTESLANGALAHFLHSPFSTLLNNVAPPGSYPQRATAPAFEQADPTNKSFKWVNKGSLNAGVLTTMAFHRNTNGWRAKANRIMGAFLCREFTVPDGIAQVGSEEADLTRKPYCQTCHTTLEPLAQFFGRWPTLGDTNYYYNPGNGVSAVGSFADVTDADTLGLGRVMTNLPEFDKCAVKSAFDFVMGRPMNKDEEELILPQLVDELTSNGKKVWPIMLKIIESPAFAH